MREVMCIHCPAVVKETDTTCVSCGGQLKDKEQGNEKQKSEANVIRCDRKRSQSNLVR
ncbi:hypothetical protein PODOV032v1_p0015 [Vibrio phage 219E41.1]|nr:hypothetical protein PODOV021v1_p0022 [Vibrio phage 219E41.2]QZI91020.1 hypothetical protein PODOV032v1_p0015 [Vibrio phage 219E41.1]QZI91163.1 hypothetical protein PODOV060v1_p0069 [Vibrio phage 234P8]QZI91545.1 hypothetical protein PODOV087v1_p0040 [Vibrio phage 431E45.1]